MASSRTARIIIGGEFNYVDGVALHHIARLNADGSLDTTFDPGTGFDNTVYALALQPDGNVVVGGAFQSFNAYSRPGLTRLDSLRQPGSELPHGPGRG